MTVILGIDPGETTGWSLWRYDPITPPLPIAHGMIPGGLRGFVAWWTDGGALVDGAYPDEVVSESFVLDGRTPFPNITPLKIEGALAVLYPETVFQRNVYKAAVPDEKIKDLGLWWPGKGHDRDSLRHVWAYLKERQHYPTLMALQPPPAHKLKLVA